MCTDCAYAISHSILSRLASVSQKTLGIKKKGKVLLADSIVPTGSTLPFSDPYAVITAILTRTSTVTQKAYAETLTHHNPSATLTQRVALLQQV